MVIGASAEARERSIAAAVEPGVSTAIILEGPPSGKIGKATLLEQDFASMPLVHRVRIAPGCLCCSGNMILRVNLNRILRNGPSRLFISLATATHLEQIRVFLTQAPYDGLLSLTTDIVV